MSEPRYAVATDAGRFYRIPGYEDTPFCAVTNIIGVRSKPALPQAAASKAAARAVDDKAAWEAMERGTAKRYIADAMDDYSEYARTLGSAVHLACQHYEEGVNELDGWKVGFDDWLEATLDGYARRMAAYKGTPEAAMRLITQHVSQYRRALSECGIVVIDRERTVFHPDWKYAGTLDIVAVIDGKVCIGDIKTGKRLYGADLELQLAAYRMATHEVDGSTSRKRDYEVDDCFALRLAPRSYEFKRVRSGIRSYDYFRAALTLCSQSEDGALTEWGDYGTAD